MMLMMLMMLMIRNPQKMWIFVGDVPSISHIDCLCFKKKCLIFPIDSLFLVDFTCEKIPLKKISKKTTQKQTQQKFLGNLIWAAPQGVHVSHCILQTLWIHGHQIHDFSTRALFFPCLLGSTWGRPVAGQMEPTILATRPGKHTKNDRKPSCLIGKLTISMAIFNSYLYVYQRLTIS